MKRKRFPVLLVFLFIILGFLLQTPISEAFEQPAPFNVSMYMEDVLDEPEHEYVLANGNMMVPMNSLEDLGITIELQEKHNVAVLTKDEHIIGMAVDSTKAYNSELGMVNLPAPPIMMDQTVMLPLRYVAENFGYFVVWNGSTRSVVVTKDKTRYEATLINTVSSVSRGPVQKKSVVVVDPGHGGTGDSGAYYYGIAEKDLNLKISLMLKDLLERKGVTVYMTRTYDKGISLNDRVNLANQVNADLFISVHNNASPDSSIVGSMSLYYPTTGDTKGNLNGQKFAQIIQEELTKELKTKNYGEIPRPNLVVLRKTAMPAVIAEVGFMTNYNELNLLKQDWYQNNAAVALCEGVLRALELQ